ncbi:MAG: hypothetical protein GY811_24730 [Myxococcales bacterium]|nr:hypothetical protein [Myxococcales bacterium]
MSETGLGTTLKRLTQHDGEWVLEVERLVPLGRHLHQPHEQKIEGANLISRHMRAVPELGEMAESTEALMAEQSPAEAYELWEGRWLDVEMVRTLSLVDAKKSESIRSGNSVAGASRKAVAKLERSQDKLIERLDRLEQGGGSAQLEKMTALVEALMSKVGSLEAKLGMDPEELEALTAVAKAAAEESGDESEVSVDGEYSESEEATSEDGGGAETDEEQEAAGEEKEKEPARPEKRMRPPSPIAMRQSLEMLVGEEIGLKERKTHTDFSEDVFFRVLILDDKNVLVGTMIADLEATVRLACKLLMLPESEITEQLGTGTASEDSTETMSEIFNTMSATINNVKSNPHVRTTPLEELDPEEFEWVKDTKRRVDLDVDGGGILSICAV